MILKIPVNKKTIFTVVPLILLLLVAIALPAYFKARAKSQLNACANNLSILSHPMSCCVPMANRLTIGATMNPAEVFQYIKGNAMPICPAGGSYDVVWIVGGPTPKCSVHGDVLWDLYKVRTMLDLDKITHAAELKQ